jgi:hypothetical protein
LPEKGHVLRSRSKKYPAIAVNEVFYPETRALEPIYKHQEPTFDVRAYVLELICSEVFIATSPSNLFGMVWAHREMARRFGKSPPSHEYVVEMIKTDITNFAQYTSLSHFKEANRRSIILVPAMTNRAVDYTVLGQASLLAAGLTTVFCNAVGGHARGQSCFIGFDGWDKEAPSITGLPGRGPYHGAEPGIYRPSASDRGLLGTEEQAMVIADIDPIFSIEGKPRPQMLLPPLRLVAHLPIIESWVPSNSPDSEDHWCRCKKMSMRPDSGFSVALRNALLRPEARAYQSTFHDTEPGRLAGALESLAKAGGDTLWLRRRREAYQAAHAADPQQWPPPVALDWIYVDLGDPSQGPGSYPRLEVPPYSKAPGEP